MTKEKALQDFDKAAAIPHSELKNLVKGLTVFVLLAQMTGPRARNEEETYSEEFKAKTEKYIERSMNEATELLGEQLKKFGVTVTKEALQ